LEYRYYPVSLDLKDKKCLVIGGGKVAERKIIALLECKAMVYVVSPKVTSYVDNLANKGKIYLEKRTYQKSDIKDSFLVIGATDDELVNKEIAINCNIDNVLLNIVDDPVKCNFILPAVLRRGSLSISISTEGKSPLLARRIKEKLEKDFDESYQEFIDLLGTVRVFVINEIKDPEERLKKFNQIIDSDILELIRRGENEKVKERINHVLGNSWSKS
jgi:precorrin-2 dehydrogenase / sirohydrochlorin ferrochelatase